jgi:bifunctional non-homologous end joining protein LigD
LLLGLWADDGLRFVGSVGSGFTERALGDIKPRLDSLRRATSPFVNQIDVPGRKMFIEPRIAVEIEYRQWTPYDRLRAPVFKGLAIDVATESVTWESEGPGRTGGSR